MSKERPRPTGRESPFAEDELIVSKTNLKGHLTYANDVFLRVAKMREGEVIGQPHNLIRHPEMPRAVFRLLWERIQASREIFAYVLNMAKDGDHYWVFAHVTPSIDGNGQVVGYHSNRRRPDAAQIAKIAPLYRQLREEESRGDDRKLGLVRSAALLERILGEKGLSYDEFVFSV